MTYLQGRSVGVVLFVLSAFVSVGFAEEERSEKHELSEPQLEREQAHSYFNGSVEYPYPIAIPRGTSGLAPSVSLAYASHTTWSNTGYGWSLSGIDAISRSAKCGVPTLGNGDTFVWRGEELVADRHGIFHTAKESFTRIERFGVGTESWWVATTPNGVKHRYGATDNSRIMAHERGDVVHRWALDRVEDASGNYYTIEYLHDQNSAVYYAQTITYTFNDTAPLPAYRTVHFAWESRPDVRTSYAEGTRRTTSLRLASVESRVDGALFTRHELSYKQGAGGKSLLTAIRVVGSDNETSLPPTQFRYSEGKPRFGEVTSYGSGFGMYISTGHNGASKMLIDINGDGLTDEVSRSQTHSRRGRPIPFEIRFGTIEGRFADAIEWEEATASSGITTTVSHKQTLYSSKLLMDMDGDGRPDIVERSHRRGREPGNYQVYLNTGSGFASAQDWGPGEAYYVMDTAGRENTTKLLMDINGDGLPDELYRPYQAESRGGRRSPAPRPEVIYNLQVRLNTGSGFGEAQDWGTMQGLYLSESFGDAYTIHELVDINGDGLPDDLYRPYARGRSGRDARPEQVSNLFVRLNTGSGFGPVEDWGTMQGMGIRETSRNGRATRHDLIDINGDGLLDDVYRSRQVGARGYKPRDHYLVRLNTGSGFGPVQSWGDGLGGTLHDSYRGTVSHTLLDINGDGLVDDVQRSPGHRLISSARRNVPFPKDYEVRLNEAGPPALLTMVQLPAGGRIVYEYGVSTQFDNTDYSGMPRLANKIHVVTAVTRDDAMGSLFTSRISYRGGLYEGYPTCEFRGFREVAVTDATGAKTVTTYLQDDACWGHSNGTQHYAADDTLLSVTASEWTYREIQSGSDEQREIVFPYVEISRTDEYDGADSARSRERHYAYDDYGNVTQVTDSGDIHVDGDEVRTTTEYASSQAGWLINRPSRQVVEDKHAGSWARARETITYYDNGAHGSVSRGHATKVDRWLAEGEYATVTFGYDVYGNTVWTRDANANRRADWPVNTAGHTKDVVFDSVFHTVPVAQRNALEHLTQIEYDALLRPVVVVDANGQRTSTAYDPHGRPVSVTRPGDVATSSTTSYAHDGVAPEYVIHRLRTVGDDWLTRYTLVDGFGRTIQEKIPVEGGFIASDRFYDVAGRESARSQEYRTGSMLSDDPLDRVTEEQPLVLLGDSFAAVDSTDDNALVIPGWARVGEGEVYYGETGTWTEPRGVNGGMVEFAGADRGDRALVVGDTDVTLGVETEIDVSDWNGRQLAFSAHYGAEYTVHKRRRSCRWIGGRKQCRTKSLHDLVEAPVVLTVTDADSGATLLETELPYAHADRIERNLAAHEIDLAAAVSNAQRIKLRLWVRLPCAGQDVSSYGFRVRNVELTGHRDQLRCILVRDPNQPAARTEYDALGRVVSRVNSDGTATTTAYDRGTHAITDANGVTHTRHVDVYDRVTAIDETHGDTVATTHYVHRPATSELQQVTDAKGGVYSFSYDGLGRKTLEHDADRGEWHMSYDPNGNLIQRRDANQHMTRFESDALNRPTRIVTQHGKQTAYIYDAGDYGIGKRTSVVTPDMSRRYGYDARGRQILDTLAIDGHTWTTGYSYDGADRLISTTYPDGEVVRTRHDARGQVLHVAGDTEYVTGASYTDYGKLARLSYANGTRLTYSYYDDRAVDPLSGSAYSYRLRTASVVGGTVDMSLEYQYDKVGNVLALIDRDAPERSQYFAYDTVDRLVSAQGVYGERRYEYDAVGNVVRFATRRYHYGSGNRIVDDGVWTYEHDANGNVTRRSQRGLVQELGYDSLGRMTSLRSDTDGVVETYAYDDGETRIKKSAGDEVTYYISSDYEERWRDGLRHDVVKHYRAGTQKVATRDKDGLRFVYPDHLGSSSRLADAKGNQVKAIWYMPFGASAREQGDATARYRFNGKEKDDSGLYYYGARYYDESLGRFLAADSMLPDVYDPQQLNRFAYVRNNPIKFVDPDGHFLIAVGALTVFGLSYITGTTIVVFGVGISAATIITLVVGADGGETDETSQSDGSDDGEETETAAQAAEREEEERRKRRDEEVADAFSNFGVKLKNKRPKKYKPRKSKLDPVEEEPPPTRGDAYWTPPPDDKPKKERGPRVKRDRDWLEGIGLLPKKKMNTWSAGWYDDAESEPPPDRDDD